MNELILQADMDDVQCGPVGPGQVVAYARPSPHKSTPNEDAIAILPWEERAVVLAVADGVGGTTAGCQAAAMAVQALQEALQQHAGTHKQLRSAIIDGIEAANDRIRQLTVDAATTLVVAEIHKHTFRTYHVGDSMILAVTSRGRVKWQTVSHSPIGMAVESGMLDETEAMYHEDRHLVSNVVGCEEMRIEIGPTLDLGRRDTVLLGSDGLFDNLLMDEVIGMLRDTSLENAVRRLADASHHRMTQPAPDQPSKPDDLALLAYRRL